MNRLNQVIKHNEIIRYSICKIENIFCHYNLCGIQLAGDEMRNYLSSRVY